MASSRAAIFINWLKMQLSGGKDANKIAIFILKHRYRYRSDDTGDSEKSKHVLYVQSCSVSDP